MTGASIDFWEQMLLADRAPTFDAALQTEPAFKLPTLDEAVAEAECLDSERERVRRNLAKVAHRYPGVILTGHAAEMTKYRLPWPPEDAPLAELVGRYLLHIRGKWSYIVGGRKPALQFNEFVVEYVAGRALGGFYEPGGRYDCAWQLLRVASGLPRFPATEAGSR